MNCSKKAMIATGVLFILLNIFGMTIHNGIMMADYAAMKGVFRPQEHMKLPFIIASYVFIAVAFVQVYLKGQEGKNPNQEGLRFGAWVSVLNIIPTYFITYAILPYETSAIVKVIICEVIATLICGVVVAHLVKKS